MKDEIKKLALTFLRRDAMVKIIFDTKKYPELSDVPPKTINLMLHEAMKEFLCSPKGKLYCEGLEYPGRFNRKIKNEILNTSNDKK